MINTSPANPLFRLSAADFIFWQSLFFGTNASRFSADLIRKSTSIIAGIVSFAGPKTSILFAFKDGKCVATGKTSPFTAGFAQQEVQKERGAITALQKILDLCTIHSCAVNKHHISCQFALLPSRRFWDVLRRLEFIWTITSFSQSQIKTSLPFCLLFLLLSL